MPWHWPVGGKFHVVYEPRGAYPRGECDQGGPAVRLDQLVQRPRVADERRDVGTSRPARAIARGERLVEDAHDPLERTRTDEPKLGREQFEVGQVEDTVVAALESDAAHAPANSGAYQR